MHKQYDRAQTPYQRLQATQALSSAQREGLAALYEYLNPVQLRKEIEEALRALWQMAQADPRAKAEAAALAKIDASRKDDKSLIKGTGAA